MFWSNYQKKPVADGPSAAAAAAAAAAATVVGSLAVVVEPGNIRA